MVVDPRKAPTSAGSRNSSPTDACPMRSFAASSTPASAVSAPEATKAPITNFRVGMPFNSAARWLAPMAYRYRPTDVYSSTIHIVSVIATT